MKDKILKTNSGIADKIEEHPFPLNILSRARFIQQGVLIHHYNLPLYDLFDMKTFRF